MKIIDLKNEFDIEKKKKEVEEKGMEKVKKYEREKGREPFDVHERNLGYDILSEGGDDVRCIEIKAGSGELDAVFTFNEWKTAKQLGKKYWLYIVTHVSSNPELNIIRDPASKLKISRQFVQEGVIKYMIYSNEWRRVIDKTTKIQGKGKK